MTITIKTTIHAPIDVVWAAWTTPADIMAWNAASEDWHTTRSQVDLRVGGRFSSRMEAKDGSAGFDFEGIYTVVDAPNRLEFDLGGRAVTVSFTQSPACVVVEESFEPEDTHPVDMQRAGWQAILNNFARHVESLAGI